MDMLLTARHQRRHGCSLGADSRLILKAVVDCLLFEAERISEVAKKVDDLKGDFEAYRAKMSSRVDQLQAAVDAATANGAEVPPGVQSQIDALAAEMEGDTASDGNPPAPSGQDNAPAGSGPSAGDTGLPEPVNAPSDGCASA
jgi:hypothetical protein